MSSRLSLKKPHKKERETSKPERFLFSIIRFIVTTYHGYLKLHVWAILFLLIIIVFIGDLRTISGLLLVLSLAIYISIPYLDKWLEKHEEK